MAFYMIIVDEFYIFAFKKIFDWHKITNRSLLIEGLFPIAHAAAFFRFSDGSIMETSLLNPNNLTFFYVIWRVAGLHGL